MAKPVVRVERFHSPPVAQEWINKRIKKGITSNT